MKAATGGLEEGLAESAGISATGWHPHPVAGMSLVCAYVLPDPEHSVPARALLVAGYMVAAFCWQRAGRRAQPGPSESSARWWWLGALMLLLLAVNKLFNLRVQFEAGFRALAKAGHWYEQRQPMQFAVAIVLPSVLGLLTAAFLAIKARVFILRNPLALAGWSLLLLYLALRQTQEWKPVLPWLRAIYYYDWRITLEVAGILLVVAAALVARPAQPSRLPGQDSRRGNS